MTGPVDAHVVSLCTPASQAETLSEWIRAAWAVEPVWLERPGSETAVLQLYFPQADAAALAALVLGANPAAHEVECRRVTTRDWDAIWRAQFTAQDVGSRLRICPPWEAAREAGRSDARRLVVIQPGMAFGTGSHCTTRFCLEILDRLCSESTVTSLLDVGTGSGIVAVAAAALGVPRVLAMDREHDAVEQAARNIRLNRVGGCVQLVQADARGDSITGRFDAVCANLYDELLIELSSKLVERAGRHLIISGIRAEAAEEVAAAFARDAAFERYRAAEDEWVGMWFEVRS